MQIMKLFTLERYAPPRSKPKKVKCSSSVTSVLQELESLKDAGNFNFPVNRDWLINKPCKSKFTTISRELRNAWPPIISEFLSVFVNRNNGNR